MHPIRRLWATHALTPRTDGPQRGQSHRARRHMQHGIRGGHSAAWCGRAAWSAGGSARRFAPRSAVRPACVRTARQGLAGGDRRTRQPRVRALLTGPRDAFQKCSLQRLQQHTLLQGAELDDQRHMHRTLEAPTLAQSPARATDPASRRVCCAGQGGRAQRTAQRHAR